MFPEIRPYLGISITECGERLVAIPTTFALTSPHAYQSLGAEYGDLSPFYLREGVLRCLEKSQNYLQSMEPNWHIRIFDAYRPVTVQKLMVDRTFKQLTEVMGWDADNLTPAQSTEIMDRVLQFWAIPSFDPATPPPHSTGAAVDVTLEDDWGQEVNMGSEIDEVSPRSFPDYFKADTLNDPNDPCETRQFQANRELLYAVMTHSGFQRHPSEWWHFSVGDQMWAWLVNQKSDRQEIARYGRYED